MIELAFPLVLLLLPLPLAVFYLLPPHRKQVPGTRFPFFRKIVVATGLTPSSGSVIFRRSILQMISAAAIWGLLVVALAQPEKVGDAIVVEKSARDIMLAIDLSGSMDQRDFPALDGSRTQRLEAVKAVVGKFISTREDDRVALIVFGTRAFVQAPFTEDLESLRALLDQTEVGMAGPHTALGDAIGLAIVTFQASEIEERLLIVLSDGGDTGSRMTPVNAASIASRYGIDILTIGVGDPEGSGDQRLDEKTLEAIAASAGGTYQFAGSEQALAQIYTRVAEQLPREVETQSYRPRQSLSHILLAAAALLGFLTVAFLQISTYRRREA
ncbi:VWA domain-containing protein [Labrenzia sp. OB1]|uniref:VWA domain-containing protein n=1 Tax=Labrenzia sp. OB1 TaxID=1561204 RepID=UPI0007B2D3DC|nr:VWA domain-containing protein [Labrenzia sp. OB1]KZM49770.1 membrane protein [Labrenzia sp. OB1]